MDIKDNYTPSTAVVEMEVSGYPRLVIQNIQIT